MDLAKGLLEEVGYLSMWRIENNLESQGRVENIEEFIRSLGDFSNIVEFLEYVSLVEARDDKNLQDAINIMTIHGAKGLEFDMVFLPGLEEGIFPSNKSVEQKNGLEEERRLMYVAITRAKKKLIMSFAKSRYIFGDMQNSLPSRFLKELPESEIDFEEVGFSGRSSYQKFSDEDNFVHDEDFLQNSKKTFYKNNFSSAKSTKNFGEMQPRKFINNLNSFASKSSSNSTANIVNYPQKTTVSKSANSSVIGSNSLIGARVFHQKFGYGKIENADGNRLTISFEKTGIKTVMKDFVSFA
jgi:DNA helicase-2/ATP-dependent DNA helicase PcrA